MFRDEHVKGIPLTWILLGAKALANAGRRHKVTAENFMLKMQRTRMN